MAMKMAGGKAGPQEGTAEASGSFDHFFRNTGRIMLAALEKSVERHNDALREMFIRMYDVRLAKAEGRADGGLAEGAKLAGRAYYTAVGEMFRNAMDALAWGESVPIIETMHNEGLLKFFAKVAEDGKLGNQNVLLRTREAAWKLVVEIVDEQEAAANVYAGLIADETGQFKARYCGTGTGEKPERQYLQLLTASGLRALS
ncbi:MAG: hypothetical protein WC759_02280 [Candidatus Micrarchaeia archaeon]|jgi:hypothetical protein